MLEEGVTWHKTVPRFGTSLLGEMASQMSPNTTTTPSSIMTNAIGSNMPGQTNMTVATDFSSRFNSFILFYQAVNGSIHHTSLSGIKERMNTQSTNTPKIFNTTL